MAPKEKESCRPQPNSLNIKSAQKLSQLHGSTVVQAPQIYLQNTNLPHTHSLPHKSLKALMLMCSVTDLRGKNDRTTSHSAAWLHTGKLGFTACKSSKVLKSSSVL